MYALKPETINSILDDEVLFYMAADQLTILGTSNPPTNYILSPEMRIKKIQKLEDTFNKEELIAITDKNRRNYEYRKEAFLKWLLEFNTSQHESAYEARAKIGDDANILPIVRKKPIVPRKPLDIMIPRRRPK